MIECMTEHTTELTKTTELSLPATSPFNFKLTVSKPSHFPTMLETFDEEQESFFRSLRLKDGKLIGLKISDLGTISSKDGIFVEIYSDNGLSAEEQSNLEKYMSNAYGLQENINDFYEHVAGDSKLKPVIDNLRGMRNSCFENLYEAMNIGIMLQNATIRRTEQMMGNMLSSYGSIIRYGGKDLFVFYTPRSILKTNEERLRDLKIGYRAKFVTNTAQYFADNEMLEEEIKQMSIEEARAKLLEIRGVGPYTANMLLFSCLRYPSFINFDVWNRKILSKFLFDNENVDVDTLNKECEKRWGKYQGYAALYIIENLFVNNPQLQYWKNKKTE